MPGKGACRRPGFPSLARIQSNSSGTVRHALSTVRLRERLCRARPLQWLGAADRAVDVGALQRSGFHRPLSYYRKGAHL